MGKQKKKTAGNVVAQNKKARHDYFIEDTIEAGIQLQGWEVKSLRSNHLQLKESYIVIKGHEAWLLGAHISPLSTASTHIHPDPIRTRKLLLHSTEINKLMGAVDRQGYTLVALDMHWRHGKAKVELGIARGKKQHDKRATEKDRDWKRDKERIMKHAS